ncbi:MAG: type I DNA topoisomerase [Clostridiales bacterium]|nr:type I DNA topoisomerase [Clostridiales bacterium]
MAKTVKDKTEKKTTKKTAQTPKKKTASKTKKVSDKTLIIVESPSKAKIISKYLGSKYKVNASVGHLRDLPKSRLGVDVSNNFEPEYINIRGKAEKIRELKKEAATAKKVLLATDPDREGEAISWHLAFLLGIDPSTDCRVIFNEINKETVREAVNSPRPIDSSLVDAQQARRVLDRLVGYQISPLLWKKVSRGLSGGRVQSAALKLICDRENEIINFVPEEYWYIAADFRDGFVAELSKINGKKAKVSSEDQANSIKNDLSTGSFLVKSVKQGKRQSKPYAPFTTSSLQQDASIKLGFQTAKTMQIAQQLYEGVNIKGIGPRGLVTYIRTDSVRISEQAKFSAKEYINDKFGENYSHNNVFSNKNKATQDAHEAIRPSDVNLEPQNIKDSLTTDQYKLYDLIWKRFLASQMSAAKYDTLAISIENGKYEFKATGSRLMFDGWKKIYVTGDKDVEIKIPELEQGDVLELLNLITEQKFTQPPSRYTEAGLVKEMEDKNIGRPSTYASIISVLIARKYVKREKKTLVPTKLGFDVISILQVYFADIVDVDFTGEMEDNLDLIELGKRDWKQVIEVFYKDFSEELKIAEQEVERIEKEVVLSDEICELCGRPMAIKDGRFGKFLACTGYPECKNTKPIVKTIGVKCPKCGKDIIERKSRKTGKIFYGCSGYPECDVSYWDKPTGEFCPICGSMVVQTKGKNKIKKCSNPECSFKEK